MSTAIHLALSEIWRNRGRYLLFSGVVALITVLILFIAALGEGLGSGNREYLEKLNGELIVGIFAIIFATLNVAGGFVVTDRMLEMFKKKKK